MSKYVTRPVSATGHKASGMTCEQIAERLGISRQRVQQIEYRALRKMAAAARARGLSFDLFEVRS